MRRIAWGSILYPFCTPAMSARYPVEYYARIKEALQSIQNSLVRDYPMASTRYSNFTHKEGS